MTALTRTLALLGLLAVTLTGLAACENTFEGMGEDVEELEEGEEG